MILKSFILSDCNLHTFRSANPPIYVPYVLKQKEGK
jgi:hypothetical protein